MDVLNTVQWFGPTQTQFTSVSSCCCQKPCLLCTCVLMICWSWELRIVLGRQVHLVIMIWLHQTCYSWDFVYGFREPCEEYTKTKGSCFVCFFVVFCSCCFYHSFFHSFIFFTISFFFTILFAAPPPPPSPSIHHLSHHDF